MLESDVTKIDPQIEKGEPNSDPQIIRLDSWRLSQSIDRGYVIPGFRLIDYIRSTWLGLDTDPPNPIHPDKPRTRFHLINVWGEQGSTKSSFVGQLLGLAYGAYDRNKSEEERRKAWDFAQKVMVCNRADLRVVAKLVPNENDRLKVIVLDDINSILGKQLAWEDRDLYRTSFELMGMVRRKTGCIITSEPNIEALIGVFDLMATFECIIYPNSTFKYDRLCHDIHPYFRGKDNLTKIVIERLSEFNPYDTDSGWWEDYNKRTKVQGNKAFEKVIDRMDELAKEKEEETNEELTKALKKAANVPTAKIIEKLRERGITVNQNKAQDIIRVAKELMFKGESNSS